LSRLLLVRHGNTEGNSALRFWGQTDIALSDDGVWQAERLAHRLSTEPIVAVYTSNLIRAVRTAEIIAGRHRLVINTCPELGEINFGQLEGLTFDEISRQYPEQAKMLAERALPTRFPGGESLAELNERVNAFINRLPEHSVGETILIVAHSGVLRLLLCNVLGIDLRHWRQLRIDLASLSILETYPPTAILTSLNDVSHLQL